MCTFKNDIELSTLYYEIAAVSIIVIGDLKCIMVGLFWYFPNVWEALKYSYSALKS